MKKGLFIVFEGIDGSGTSTQIINFARHLKELSKYLDVLLTREPWKSEEINRRLAQDRDAYSGAREMAALYIDDRESHTEQLIKPVIDQGCIVLSDRYSMSTCAYQSTQGMDLDELLRMHRGRGILKPDLTFFLRVSLEEAIRRIKLRGNPTEKFERDVYFIRKLISRYEHLVSLNLESAELFGQIEVIDGEQSVEKVFEEIKRRFSPFYESWAKR